MSFLKQLARAYEENSKLLNSLDEVERRAYLLSLHFTIPSEIVKALSASLHEMSSLLASISLKLDQEATIARDIAEGTIVSLKYLYGDYEDDPKPFTG